MSSKQETSAAAEPAHVEQGTIPNTTNAEAIVVHMEDPEPEAKVAWSTILAVFVSFGTFLTQPAEDLI